jgi:hypothetical protein
MKKIVSAFALVAIAVAGVLALGIGTASAHNADISYNCTTVTVNLTDFPVVPADSPNTNSATITVNGTDHVFTWKTADFTATIPYVPSSTDTSVYVVVHATGADGETAFKDDEFSTEGCTPPPTTTTTAPPTTTTTSPAQPQVEPAVVVRPAAAVAVVAAPAFTG